MTPKAATTATHLVESESRPRPQSRPYTQAMSAAILTALISRNPTLMSIGRPYAFSFSGSPKMPVGRTKRTRMRIVNATASRMGVEMYPIVRASP